MEIAGDLNQRETLLEWRRLVLFGEWILKAYEYAGERTRYCSAAKWESSGNRGDQIFADNSRRIDNIQRSDTGNDRKGKGVD